MKRSFAGEWSDHSRDGKTGSCNFDAMHDLDRGFASDLRSLAANAKSRLISVKTCRIRTWLSSSMDSMTSSLGTPRG
jgi:hypothetical protein